MYKMGMKNGKLIERIRELEEDNLRIRQQIDNLIKKNGILINQNVELTKELEKKKEEFNNTYKLFSEQLDENVRLKAGIVTVIEKLGK